MARDRGRMEVGPGMPAADVSGRPPFSQAEPLKPPPTDTGWLKTDAGMTVQQRECPECAEIERGRGVWVVYYHDQGPHVESVHASELEALRQVNDGAGKHAVFVPFGAEVREVLR